MGAAAWSGNWIFRFEPQDGGWRISGGLSDWEFAKTLAPGESMETAHVMLAQGADLNAVSQQFARAGRRYWYPNPALPVEWNHWWSYEDFDINETAFRENAARAEALGFELCTLDAGWFGEGAEWYRQRGDWEVVQPGRFPHGIRALADEVHARGMKFGLWCEIEAVGEDARLKQTHPELVATRDGEPLGYVCMGNPDAQAWAYQSLTRLIREYDCDWIKLDFNLDPGAGCNRTDHGHGAGDGLYAHVQGYYALLDRVKAAYPNVILENCSSGGLQIDLGMLKHTDLTFLSDPDYPVHDLQVFWGASLLLAPDACLHWSFSEWCNPKPPPQQNFNPRDPGLQPHQLDYYTRAAMLGAFGISQRLPALPDWIAERLAHHVGVYKRVVRRFVREAELYRLTDQPRRDGSGDRWCGFQYSLPDEHLLFIFRLPGAKPERIFRLLNLQADQVYRVENTDGNAVIVSQRGGDLMEHGLLVRGLHEEDSLLLRLF